MATSLIITSTNSLGAKYQKSVTNINPNASNEELRLFAQKLVDLTNNTYASTERVEKINVDNEERLLKRNITLENPSKGATATLNFNWNSELDASTKPAIWSWSSGTSFAYVDSGTPTADGSLAKCTFSVPSNCNTLYIGIIAKNGFDSEFKMVPVS